MRDQCRTVPESGTCNHQIEIRFRTTFAFNVNPHGGAARSHCDIEREHAHAGGKAHARHRCSCRGLRLSPRRRSYRARTSREIGHATVTWLPREEGIEGGARLSLPGSNFVKEIAEGLAWGLFGHRAHLNRQLLINPNAHWLRRVALECLDRLVEG
jgi:hypothetical protein